jgi:hypothetical protein
MQNGVGLVWHDECLAGRGKGRRIDEGRISATGSSIEEDIDNA